MILNIQSTFELTNHLGNVLAVVSDRKIAVEDQGNPGTVEYYEADVVSARDYYPFGMIQPGRSVSAGEYRYGMHGMEMDNEWSGDGNHYTTEFRQYDPRVGRWMSLDPAMKKYASLSPYNFNFNNPVYWDDPDGDDPNRDYPTKGSEGGYKDSPFNDGKNDEKFKTMLNHVITFPTKDIHDYFMSYVKGGNPIHGNESGMSNRSADNPGESHDASKWSVYPDAFESVKDFVGNLADKEKAFEESIESEIQSGGIQEDSAPSQSDDQPRLRIHTIEDIDSSKFRGATIKSTRRNDSIIDAIGRYVDSDKVDFDGDIIQY